MFNSSEISEFYNSETSQSLGPADLADGFQVETLPTSRMDAPGWVYSDAVLRQLFPANKRKWTGLVMQRAAVLYRVWRLGMTPAAVAKELHTTESNVRHILARLRIKGDHLYAEKH